MFLLGEIILDKKKVDYYSTYMNKNNKNCIHIT